MKVKKILSPVLAGAIALTGFTPLRRSAFAASDTFVYTQISADEAIITAPEKIQYVVTGDTDVVSPSIDGETAVLRRSGETAGIAEVTIVCENGSKTYEVPVGYTTFIFDDDGVTVCPGSDTSYEITGTDSAGTEYTPVGEADENGYTRYASTDEYALVTSIKKKGGTYVFSGKNSNMSIAVNKGATADAVLLLCGLDLASAQTAPITVKKDSSARVTITSPKGHENKLTDSEYNNADNYADNALAESAVIKAKASAKVTLNGEGTLELVCKSKNAVKVGEYGSLTAENLTLNVTSEKNGLSSDNEMTINSGTISITSAADAIRSDPDTVDATAGCAGKITINGGSFNITAGTDGIQAARELDIYGGNFNIKTAGGYNDSSFNSDTSSAKGLKASSSAADSSASSDDAAEASNTIGIYGGTFKLNTADDAIHSDAYVTVEKGEFEIYTGDDAVHADTTAEFGTENGSDCGVMMDIKACYEGLEAGTLYINSGYYSIISSDDGINAAGGSDSSDNGGGFNPGGGRPGGWWSGPGGNTSGGSSSADSDYSINISGGLIYIYSGGDGIDSNGDLNITGGKQIVWGGNSPENPLDYDGNFYINGSETFGAGSNDMAAKSPISGSQSHKTYSSSVTKGQTVLVTEDGKTKVSLSAPKTVKYIFWSSPALTSSNGSISTSTSAAEEIPTFDVKHSRTLDRTTEAECMSDGTQSYVCSECGACKTESIAGTGHDFECEFSPVNGKMHSALCRNCGDTIFAPCVDEDGDDSCDVCGGAQSEENVSENKITVNAYPSPENGILSGSVDCTFENTSGDSISGTAFAAIYKGKKLVGTAKNETETLFSPGKTDFSITADQSNLNESGYLIKIFVWNSALSPLSACAEINL